jgi:hypothetical protein
MAHCNRELYQQQWSILLDDEFLHAYAHGIAIDGGDGIRRRVYPRIFAYSADYPEKQVTSACFGLYITEARRRIIVAGICNLGRCPCPQCLMPLDRVKSMGRPLDMAQHVALRRQLQPSHRARSRSARKIIYESASTVNCSAVENLLQEFSLVPAIVGVLLIYDSSWSLGLQNAFSDKLSQFGFSVNQILVVDLMHEFELGVWKAVFIHLLRILDCAGMGLKHELDRRWVAGAQLLRF